ncbi:MAG: YbaB/EbfC family nucleoid-associated protein [Thermoanaerobaculia bacterium]
MEPTDPRMQKMLDRARKMKEREQRRLAKMTVTATALKGKVKATINGHRALVEVHVDPELMSADGGEELEGQLLKVINNAATRIDDKLGSKYGTLDSLPGLFSDFFDPDK